MSWLTLDRQREIDAVIDEIKRRTGKSYPDANILDIIRSDVPNIQIQEYDFGDDSPLIKGAIKYPKNGNPAILINHKRKSPTERNFTLAHEFGHFKLHRDKDSFRLDLFDYAADTQESIEETEANYFAGSLLMPKNEMEELLLLTQDNEKIASYFGVSVTAVEKRRKWLRINKTK